MRTLIERFDNPDYLDLVTKDEICRALAIAQAVEEHPDYWTVNFSKENIMRRADELLDYAPQHAPR